jgi:hypothetical protein
VPAAIGAIEITATGTDLSSTKSQSGSSAGTVTRALSTGNALPRRGA